MTPAPEMLASCPRWAAAWVLPDRRPIYEWASDGNIVLPQGIYGTPGPFDIRLSRWMIPVFDDLQSGKVRKVHVRKGIQSGGTLIAEIWVPWLIVNKPGSVSWTMQTDDMMEKHLKGRLLQLWQTGCPPLKHLLPRIIPLKMPISLYTATCPVYFNAANKSSQQGQSIQNKINDEIWLPQWQDVYAHAIGRVDYFKSKGNSKILNISQGGFAGDVEDLSFIEGNQCKLYFTCWGCGKDTPLAFAGERPDGSRYGVVWEKDARGNDGYWNVARAVETCRYECEQCRETIIEGEKFRAQMQRTQHFIPQNLGAPPTETSYHIESMVTQKMSDLVQQFCNAHNAQQRGFPQSMINFKQQKQAMSYTEEKARINMRAAQIDPYRYSAFRNGEKWAGEDARCMTVDRQKIGFWVEVTAWKKNADSRQLYYGFVETIETVREIQLNYKVADGHCFEDCGYDQPGAFDDCVRFGWWALKGASRQTWTHPDTEEKIRHFYSHYQVIQHNGKEVYLIFFSADDCKNILASRLSGVKARHEVPIDVSQAWREQQDGEIYKETKLGRYSWVKIGPNHAKDTSTMGIVFALIKGYVTPESEEAVPEIPKPTA